jgi:uncharacterized protein (TIGR02145 family)
MKNKLSLFVSIFLLMGQLQAQNQIPNYVPTTGLVGWWPFNGNANDESGNGNNGTVNGANLSTDRFGNVGKAYSFDGINDWIQVAHNSSLDFSISQQYSLSFWLKINVNTINTGNVICKWDNSYDPYPMNVSISSNTDGSLITMGRYGGGTTQNQTTIQSISDSISQDQYQHIVLNFSQSTGISYYLNGSFIGISNINNITSITNIYPLYFGRRGIRTDRFYAGYLDDIGIWNRSLTQQEITNLYNAGPFEIATTTPTICAGQPVTLSVSALSGSISGLTCASATNNGTLTAGVAASGVNSVVPYTGGNSGIHNGQTVTSTGVTGLTATLSAGSFANGAGNLTYTITGTPITNGTASFALNIGGQSCTLSRTVVAGTISALTCTSASNNGTLTAGVAASGVSSIIPYTGGNGGTHNGQTVVSTGITGLTATLSSGSFANGAGNLTYTITGTPSTSGTASFAISIGGKTCTLTRTVAAGTITALSCASATNNGTLTAGVTASSVSSVIPYTGGNGGIHNGQTVTSTGITGLTATLSSGSFANGSGSLTYTITGTPSASGTASFALNIGGQSCTLNLTVIPNPSNQYPSGTVHCNGTATAVVDVTNPTTGKTWMDRNLGASQVATSSTDANAYGDLYQWGRNADGHQCRNSATTGTRSSIDQPTNTSFVLASGASPYDWRNPQNHNLWQGVNGINNPCPSGYRVPTESEFEAERASFNSLNSNGAFGSPLKFTIAGYRNYIDGSLNNVNSAGYYWSSTVNNSNSRFLMIGSYVSMQKMNRSLGHSVRCIKQTSAIGSLNCENASVNGNVISGQIINNVSLNLPYSSGNGDNYSTMLINSTGVTGIIATISSGQFNNGSGNLTFVLSGTPSGIGEAFFDVNIGGQICTFNVNVVSSSLVSLYPSGSLFCNGPTEVVEVLNPTTGKIWMDRNLGASQVATSSTDINSFGDLYQWGRKSDGHQCRSSTTTSISSATDQALSGSFILSNISPYDWRSPQNINLWQGLNGVNNPCPSGYRLPTQSELNIERLSWFTNTSVGAFSSPLKLPMAGTRSENSGLFFGLDTVGGDTEGNYWSSNVSSNNSTYLNFYSGFASFYSVPRGRGFSVRCIKETVGSIGSLNCGSSTVTGNLIAGVAASGVSASVPYTGGNGGFYAAQSIASTGVTGLTATISQGLFASGAGNLVYTISGTPNASGTASFVLNVGGQTCTLTLSVDCWSNHNTTAVVDVTNPATGKTWMDRNLGASRAATSSTDAQAYGDLYQWGRRSDGHQCRISETTSTLSSSDQPTHGNFILAPNSPYDWRSPQNNNLWQGVNGVNNPCPSGYRLPTETDLNAERSSWIANTSDGAFASPLKLPVAGRRNHSLGTLDDVESFGLYWSSTVGVTGAISLYFSSSNAVMDSYRRSRGFSVRCIKN